MSEPIWCVMPILSAPELTETAISDVLAQSVPVRLLLINQGVDDAFRDRLERLAEQEERILLWSHQPSLPSLSATWNRALDFVWSTSEAPIGEQVAFVVNNDVRLHADTVEWLAANLHEVDALFVSAVGVTAEQFHGPPADLQLTKGGPDFSCFLISHACHNDFRFDERFIPAFCEDLDYHRRLMLAGQGQRIFSVNLPYLHYASQTLKTLPPLEASRIDHEIAKKSRAYYERKWGGPVNHETSWRPFNEGAFPDPVYLSHFAGEPTTPALFDYERKIWSGPPLDELNRRMLNLGDPVLDQRFADVTKQLEEEYRSEQEAPDGQDR